jgi:hypothetical protein
MRIRALALTGLLLLLVDLVEGEILPRLEGSAEPSLLGNPPYSWFDWARGDHWAAALAVPVALSLALLALFGLLYALALALARGEWPRRGALAVVLTVTLGFGVVSAIAPPARKADIFYYAFQGRMLARGGLNPYAVPPRAFAADPWFPLVSPVWRDLPTGYGPVWLLLSEGLDRVADDGGQQSDSIVTILAYRALFLGSVLGSAVAIWSILGKVAPDRRLFGTLAFAWNPVVPIAGFEHNDAVMLLFATLGLGLHLRRRETLAVLALTFSALVKYYTIPLLVAYLIWRWRAHETSATRRLAPVIMALATIALVFVPFDPLSLGPRFLTYLTISGRVSHVARLPLELTAGIAVAQGIGFARIRRDDRLTQLLAVGVAALLVYLALLSRDWFSWYLVTALGLSAILGGWWLGATAVAAIGWTTGFHSVEAYLVALVSCGLGLEPARGIVVVFFLPSLGFVAMYQLWSWRRWNEAVLAAIGAALVVAGLIAAELPLVSQPSLAPIQADLGGGLAPGPVVFGSALEWDDWSWDTTLNQSAQTTGSENQRTLCVTTTAPGGAFYAHHPGFSTSPYGEVDFDLSPVGAPASSLALTLRDAQGQSLQTVHLGGFGQSSPSDPTWYHIRLPLASLDAVGTTVSGLVLQDTADPPGQSFCLRDLAFR